MSHLEIELWVIRRKYKLSLVLCLHLDCTNVSSDTVQVHHQTDGKIRASNICDLKIVIQHEIVTYQLIRFCLMKNQNAFKSYVFL